jgi:coenzyme F420 biosynthesis associated uncharacterized protein
MPDRPPDPVDWRLAERTAHRVARDEPLARSYLARSLEPDFQAATARAEELVVAFTGLQPDGPPAAAHVVGRDAWASTNIRSFRAMLRPFTDKVGERLAANRAAGLGRAVAGVELGVLTGYLSQRVLGQYDLLVPEEGEDDDDPLVGAPADPGAVYYVGPNVLALEKRFAFRPADFRLWIALHEVTHRVQFTGVPWMRDYFLGLVEELVSAADPDPQRLSRAISRALEELRGGRNPLDEGGIVALAATDEQRDALQRVTALMSLLEGHGNVVMDRLGAEHVAGQDRMSRVLRARRAQRGPGRLLLKLVGIESKMRQYEVGERFIAAVEERAGLAAIDAAWTSPDHLPTVPELDDPDGWLERVGVPASA